MSAQKEEEEGGGGMTVNKIPRAEGEGEWSITRPWIFDRLAGAQGSVLIAGCGGGYDILSGLPLYFALKREGRSVILANFSFTYLRAMTDTRYCEGCVCVSHDMELKWAGATRTYFPEYYLTQWLWKRLGEKVVVYAFERECGVVPLSHAYRKIVSEHSVGAIVLVDGGTDSLMFGNEERMGTPTEDQTSIMAVSAVEGVSVKLLACIGFGVDTYHGVSHGLFLENVATLEKAGGYLGSFSVPRASMEGKLYMEGYRHVCSCMQPSIVCASVTDAMQGHFGDYHSTTRTGASQLFINALMPVYWTFELPTVVAMIPYARDLLKTRSASEVVRVIADHHDKAGQEGKLRCPVPLPM